METHRRLADSSASGASGFPPSGTFSVDGSSSNLALQLYNQFAAGDSVEQLELNDVPTSVVNRLSDVGVAFEDLDGLAQRAVLWDSGFAVTPANDAKQIWALEGYSMADIAVSFDEYNDLSCSAFNCTQPDATEMHNNQECTGTEMLKAVKCVAESFESDDLYLAMWSVGGNTSTTPDIQLLKHSWTDGGEDYVVFAVHTLSDDGGRNYGACPTGAAYGFLTIPCYGDDDVPSGTITVEATPTAWITAWMEQYAPETSSASSGASLSSGSVVSSDQTDGSKSASEASASAGGGDGNSSNSSSVALLAGTLGGGLALALIVLVVGLIILFRRKNQRERMEDEEPKHVELQSPETRYWSEGRRPTVSTYPRTTQEDLLHGSPGERNFDEDLPAAADAWFNAVVDSETSRRVANLSGLGPDGMLQSLADDPNVSRKRFSIDQLRVERQLPMTNLDTDACVGRYNGRQVLVKRIAPASVVRAQAVEGLAAEIMIRASVRHPNILQFVGVAWTSGRDLTMALEFPPNGDLKAYLTANKASMHVWDAKKDQIALGIARAVGYLHQQTPALIHRELSAKSVLLTSDLEAKLEHCGSADPNQHPGGVASTARSYWTAPEVLAGGRYSTASDIYAFGVLLSELDTCESPYHNVVAQDGAPLQANEVLEQVMQGTLRPGFSASCPRHIRQLGVACVQHHPERRPTAVQVLQFLGGNTQS